MSRQEPVQEQIQERIAGAVLGAFIGDTLSLGVHWIYNPRHITRVIGRLSEPIDPIKGADRYHPNRQRGQFTHFGDQALVLMRSIVASGGWSLADFKERWTALWDGYDGYLDGATKKTLQSGSSDSNDLSGFARMAPLLIPPGPWSRGGLRGCRSGPDPDVPRRPDQPGGGRFLCSSDPPGPARRRPGGGHRTCSGLRVLRVARPAMAGAGSRPT
jgi:hypothetical protein